MRINKNIYTAFERVVIRTPFFPFDVSDKINMDFFKDLVNNEIFKESIFLASPLLYSELQKWIEGKLTTAKEIKKLHYSLIRYYIRMCTRCTPFGLFAGCTAGEIKQEKDINEKSKIILAAQYKYKLHTRLDMNYLCELSQDLAKQEKIKLHLKYFPNTSIYELGKRLRYVEYYYKNTKRFHHIAAVDNSDYLQMLLYAAQNGVYIHELVQLLTSNGIDREQSENFIDELISSQLLVSELEPAVTGDELLEQMLKILDTIQGIDEIKEKLQHLNSVLKTIDNQAIGQLIGEYKNIAKILGDLGTKYEMQYIFQADMIKPAIECSINSNMLDDIKKGLEILNKLTPNISETNISQFRDAFYERYEMQEMPLALVLDIETGIGYLQNSKESGDISPLVGDVWTPSRKDESKFQWTPVYSLFHRKYLQAIKENKLVIEITDADLKPFNAESHPLPDTISAMVQIFKDKIYINSAGGSGAANLLGRFCYADAKILDFVKEIVAKEQENNPDAILAEIVHLQESRIGNILFRPVLRNYEIPYLAKSTVKGTFQIKLNDLMLSVKGGRLVLRSKKLNKEIIPRLSTAHNYSHNALPVYRFLCDLQTQNIYSGLGFNWGPLANEYSFLPRVIYKNLILSFASWKVKKEEIKYFFKTEDDEELINGIREWRVKNKIPAYIVLEDGDNELFINLENALMIRTLFSVIKNREAFQIQEFLFDPETAIVKSEEGSFNNQFIFAFYKEKNKPETS